MITPDAWSWKRIGAYTANELQIEVYPGDRSPAGRIPIIWCHGFSLLAQPSASVQGGPWWPRLAYIAEVTGCPLIAADLGGNAWSNATARTLFGTLRTWIGANLGCRTDKFAVGGESMGSILAANMAWRTPAECVALWMRAHIPAMQTFHDVNLVPFPGLSLSMEAAFTNLAGLVAAYPTVDPAAAANRAILASLGPRTRVDYRSDDQFIAPELVEQYARDTGCIAVAGRGDHDGNLYTDQVAVAEWFRAMIDANG